MKKANCNSAARRWMWQAMSGCIITALLRNGCVWMACLIKTVNNDDTRLVSRQIQRSKAISAGGDGTWQPTHNTVKKKHTLKQRQNISNYSHLTFILHKGDATAGSRQTGLCQLIILVGNLAWYLKTKADWLVLSGISGSTRFLGVRRGKSNTFSPSTCRVELPTRLLITNQQRAVQFYGQQPPPQHLWLLRPGRWERLLWGGKRNPKTKGFFRIARENGSLFFFSNQKIRFFFSVLIKNLLRDGSEGGAEKLIWGSDLNKHLNVICDEQGLAYT